MEMYIYISDLYIRVVVYVCVTCVSNMVGCHNGGGGGVLNFSKAKQLVATWIGSPKQLFSERKKGRKKFAPGWYFRNAGSFSYGTRYS